MAPDVVKPQDHEADQQFGTPPLVPHLLPEPNHPVGPLHVIVGPDPLAHGVVQISYDLGELLRADLLQSFDQLGHPLEGGVIAPVPRISAEFDPISAWEWLESLPRPLRHLESEAAFS